MATIGFPVQYFLMRDLIQCYITHSALVNYPKGSGLPESQFKRSRCDVRDDKDRKRI